MHVLIKRTAQKTSTAAGMLEEPLGATVKVQGESSASAASAPARTPVIEGKRARKLRLMQENGERFVTFYISAALWKRFVKLYCPRGTTPNMVFCRMIRQAVEGWSEDGAQIVFKRG